jgi:hypothetical protein
MTHNEEEPNELLVLIKVLDIMRLRIEARDLRSSESVQITQIANQFLPGTTIGNFIQQQSVEQQLHEDHSTRYSVGEYMNEKYEIRARDITASQFGSNNSQTINDSFNTFATKHGKQDDLLEQMKNLSECITALVADLEVQDPNAAQEVTETFQSFAEESAKDEPKTGTLRALGNALVDAARKVVKVAAPVATTVAAVLQIFGIVL